MNKAEQLVQDGGNCYWCVKSPLSENGEIYVCADEIRVDSVGCLYFLKHSEDNGPVPTLVLAPGQWLTVYAANVLSGAPVSVDPLKGKVI